MGSRIIRRIPMLLGIAVGAVLVAGLGMEIQGGNLGLGMVLGVAGIAVIEFSVALSAVNENILLFFPSFKRPHKVSTDKSYQSAEQASGLDKMEAPVNEAKPVESGAQISLASHPALGQVDMGIGTISLKNTAGGIYIDSMDSVKQSIQSSLKEEKTDKQEKVKVKSEKSVKKKIEKKTGKGTVSKKMKTKA